MTLRVRFNFAGVVAGCLIILIFFLLRTQIQSEPKSLPPLAGTYQYFHEIDFHSTSHRLGAVSHFDSRYAHNGNLDDQEFRHTLLGLMHSYVSTMRDLKIETWLAHGTLLGWYWNHKFLPWDTDIDVQVSDLAIVELATKHNMSEFEYHLPNVQSVRKYLLDINPHYLLTTSQDVANKIDGRWIDLTNGKFIDITAVYTNKDKSGLLDLNSLFCKDGHRYRVRVRIDTRLRKLISQQEERCLSASTL